MSDTRRTRSSLRQSLIQHLFHYYEELKTTTSEEEAKKTILFELESFYKMFNNKEETLNVSFLSSIDELEKEYVLNSKKAMAEKDYDMIYYSEDVLKSLKIVKSAFKEKGKINGTK